MKSSIEMWRVNGATEEKPRPFLKYALSRVVSIAMVSRSQDHHGQVTLNLRVQPRDPENSEDCSESVILSRFLESVGRRQPQLVGFNSTGSDLPIFIQRGIINGITAAGFCKRPDKPWEGYDYFSRASEWNVDLMSAIGDWGKARPSLKEMAVLSGIPGKMEGFDGDSVAEAWLGGDIKRIAQYNQHDAVTTYLVWLRIAHFAGFFNDEQYRDEQDLVRSMLEEKAKSPENGHLAAYVLEWDQAEGDGGGWLRYSQRTAQKNGARRFKFGADRIRSNVGTVSTALPILRNRPDRYHPSHWIECREVPVECNRSGYCHLVKD